MGTAEHYLALGIGWIIVIFLYGIQIYFFADDQIKESDWKAAIKKAVSQGEYTESADAKVAIRDYFTHSTIQNNNPFPVTVRCVDRDSGTTLWLKKMKSREIKKIDSISANLVRFVRSRVAFHFYDVTGLEIAYIWPKRLLEE